jgi:hypothetical protein
MEKLQRRLRLFIILALLTGAAAALFVGTASAQGTVAEAVTIQDLGLASNPPAGGLASWWDSFTDTVRLQFTFNGERKAELQLQRAAKLLARLEGADGDAAAEQLLARYRQAINRVATGSEFSDSFLDHLLAQQSFLTQIEASGRFSLADQIATTRSQNWQKLDAAAGDAGSLSQRLAGLAGSNPERVARRAALLEEWRQRLSPEQQAQAKAAVIGLVEKLRSLAPGQAAAIAERLRSYTSSQGAQAYIGSLLEGVQPSLQGLAAQLAQPRQPNQDPTPSYMPTGNLGDVAVPAMTTQEVAARRAELAEAVTREELLALRLRWYGNAILYRQLSQYQRSLLDQLNAKLVRALGQGGQDVAPAAPVSPDAGVVPLPTQQLTPEQQSMGEVFIRMQGIDPNDVPPPTVSY